MTQAWKIAPGQGADHWNMCRTRGCIALGWRGLANFRRFKCEKDILEALSGGPGDGVGAAQSIWRFVHDVQASDIVIANKGRRTIVGIGVVRSDYLPPKSAKNPSDSKFLPNARLVEWLIDKPIEFPHFIFAPQTVHLVAEATLAQIEKAYSKKYPEFSETLYKLFANCFAGDGIEDGGLIEDLKSIEQRAIPATMKEALVKARIGQGRFRTAVLHRWDQCCAVTRSSTHEALRASHIKPWKASTDMERLDPNNGIPLVASLDALFDAGLISFESSGEMVFSKKLKFSERELFGIVSASLTRKPNVKMAEYLAYHRKVYRFQD